MKLNKHFVIFKQVIGLIIVGLIWSGTLYGIYRSATKHTRQSTGIQLGTIANSNSLQLRQASSELSKRADWREASIDGAVSTFSYVMNGANLI